MKSTVAVDVCCFRLRAISILIFAAVALQASAAEFAECNRPPGGNVQCERNQMARCEVRRGEVYGRCVTPPANLRGRALDAWTLSQVLNRNVNVSELERPELNAILVNRRFDRADSVVTFDPPASDFRSPGFK